MGKYAASSKGTSTINEEVKEDLDGDDDDDDEVFEKSPTQNMKKTDSGTQPTGKEYDQWHDLYETIERMKYLDMFVREVLRMFPIANSMVSRKCVVKDMWIDLANGSYPIPYGMNIVVDVMSIHFDPVLWGPVDPNVFYPERFLTERNPAAWLPFGN